MTRRKLLRSVERQTLLDSNSLSSGLVEMIHKVERVFIIPIGDVVSIVRRDFKHLQHLIQSAVSIVLDLNLIPSRTSSPLNSLPSPSNSQMNPNPFNSTPYPTLNQTNSNFSSSFPVSKSAKSIPPKMLLKIHHRTTSTDQ